MSSSSPPAIRAISSACFRHAWTLSHSVCSCFSPLLSFQVSVTAIEKDENVIEMARLNPWSQPLFENSKIRLIQGDAAEIVPGIGDATFDIVNHDPPTLSVAGELYADALYAHLLRILKPGGKLLHYTGAPGSRGRRVDLNGSVSRRLARIGFTAVRTDAETACIAASRCAPWRRKTT